MAELVECSDDFRVERAHLAVSVGSGDVEVLSTPSLLAFVESVASRCLSGAVSPGYTTVGTYVELRHKAPAPQGATEQGRLPQEGRGKVETPKSPPSSPSLT